MIVEPLESRRLLSAAIGPDLQSVLSLITEYGAQGSAGIDAGTLVGGELAQPIDDGVVAETETPTEQAADPTVVVGPVLPEEAEEPAPAEPVVDPSEVVDEVAPIDAPTTGEDGTPGEAAQPLDPTAPVVEPEIPIVGGETDPVVVVPGETELPTEPGVPVTPTDPVIPTDVTPPTDPVAEAPTTPVDDPVLPTEPVVEIPTEPVVEIPTEPVVEIPTEPVVEVPTDPVVEPPIDPVEQVPTDPVVEVPAGPVVVEVPLDPVGGGIEVPNNDPGDPVGVTPPVVVAPPQVTPPEVKPPVENPPVINQPVGTPTEPPVVVAPPVSEPPVMTPPVVVPPVAPSTPPPLANTPTTPVIPQVNEPANPIDVGPETPIVTIPKETETPTEPGVTPTPTKPSASPVSNPTIAAEPAIQSEPAAASAPVSHDIDANVAVTVAVADDHATGEQIAHSSQDDAADRKMTPLMKVMWSFAVDSPIVKARMLRAQIGEATLAASNVSVDPILKVVQEFTIVAPDAYGTTGTEAVDSTNIVATTAAARANLAAALADPNYTNRNIILALAGGSAALAVTWYRARQRKLQIAAMKLATLMQFDPLAVWCDDAEDEREFV